MSHRFARTRRSAALSGLATGVLFLGASALWALDQPGREAPAPELLGFYDRLADRIVAGALISLVAIAALVVFASALRRVLAELDHDTVLADVAFAGALLAAASGLGAETINMAAALRAHDAALTAPLAQALFDVSYVLGYNAAGIGLGLVALAVAAVALRTGALLPRWLALVTVALGVALLTPLSRYALGPSFALLLVLSGLLLRRTPQPQ